MDSQRESHFCWSTNRYGTLQCWNYFIKLDMRAIPKNCADFFGYYIKCTIGYSIHLPRKKIHICIMFVFGRKYISKFIAHVCSLFLWILVLFLFFDSVYVANSLKMKKKKTIKLGCKTMNEWHLCVSVWVCAAHFTVHFTCRVPNLSTDTIYKSNAEQK